MTGLQSRARLKIHRTRKKQLSFKKAMGQQLWMLMAQKLLVGQKVKLILKFRKANQNIVLSLKKNLCLMSGCLTHL